MRLGSRLNGTELETDLGRSFSVRVCRSTSANCQSYATTLSFIPRPDNETPSDAKLLSAITVLTMNPRLANVLLIPLMLMTMVSFLGYLNASTVPNFSDWRTKPANFIVLTYITSKHTTTSRWRVIVTLVIDCASSCTCGSVRRMVFLFRDPISGKNIVCALQTSCSVSWQFGNCLCNTISCMCRSFGRHIIYISMRAFSDLFTIG